MIELIRRRDAAQAAVDRFIGKPLAWGRADCIRLGAFVCRRMGRPVSLAKAGEYSSLLGAKRALLRTGFATVEAAIDAQGLRRIAPASALTADLVALPGNDDGLLSLNIAIGNGRLFGVLPGTRVFGPMQPTAEGLKHAIAWSVGRG